MIGSSDYCQWTVKMDNQKIGSKEILSLRTDIIGGMFGLELSRVERTDIDIQRPAFLLGSHLLLATNRSAFTLLVRSLNPKTVWLPSYLCGVVLGAFPTNLMKIRFYPVNDRLRITEDGWLSKIQTNDMVVFIDYFGFNHWAEWGAEARGRGAWVIEDAAQALLNEHHCKHSHFVVFSPRKFVGVPDGGILKAVNGAKLPEIDLPSQPEDWWMEATRASLLRAEWDRHGGERTWFEIFQKTEIEGPLEPCRMSEMSIMILMQAIDWRSISSRRRDNYKFLSSELEKHAIFPELPGDVVPLGFPIRMKDRARIRNVLFAKQIYPLVHWSIVDIVPPEFKDSHVLSDEIMTIPCDQRYNLTDMERVVEQIKIEVSH